MNKNIRTLNFTGCEEDEMRFVREKDLVLRILMEKLTDKQIVEQCRIVIDALKNIAKKRHNLDYEKDTIEYLSGVSESYTCSYPHRLSYQQRFFTCRTLANNLNIAYWFFADYIRYEHDTGKVIIYYKGQFQEVREHIKYEYLTSLLKKCGQIDIGSVPSTVELILHKNTYEEVFRNYKLQLGADS